MNPYVTNLSITNFRSCQDLSLELSRFTPLVGYNNAGKSNILTALEWVLKERLLDLSEFCDPEKEVVVEARVAGISQSILDRLEEGHRSRIVPRMEGETILIRRSQPATATKKGDVKFSVYDSATDQFKPNPAGLWAAIKALFPDSIRIGAMENAAEDATKSKASSTIGKLLSELSSGVQLQHQAEINTHLDSVRAQIGAEGNARFDALSQIDEAINLKVEEFFPGISLKLHFEVPSFQELFSKGTVKVFENAVDPRDFEKFGHGAQRSIQMALIRHLAEVRQTADTPTTTMLLIDEPELYLHPFAIEQIRESLHALSRHGYQVIFSTHSAQMITQEHAQHALLIRKDGDGTHARKRLQDAIREVIPNAESQIAHLFSLTQSNAILFADQVLLTEGKTEQTLFPHIYKAVTNRTLGQDQTALIQAGGVDSFAKTMKILREMDLPTKAIADLDYAFRGAISAGMIDADNDSIHELKLLFASMAADGEIAIDMAGLPRKNGANVSAAKAYEMLASKPEAQPHIEALHTHLLDHGVWLWPKGAIEVHLGLEAKNHGCWSNFKEALDCQTFAECCSDPDAVADLISWLQSNSSGLRKV